MTVLLYDFPQKNNKFVKNIVTRVFPRCVKSVRVSFDIFVKVLRCPVYNNPYLWGITLEAS